MKNNAAQKRKQVPAGYLVVGVDPHKSHVFDKAKAYLKALSA